jgi:hypothetical protein
MRLLGFAAIVCLGIVVLIASLFGAALIAIAHSDPEVPGCSP